MRPIAPSDFRKADSKAIQLMNDTVQARIPKDYNEAVLEAEFVRRFMATRNWRYITTRR